MPLEIFHLDQDEGPLQWTNGKPNIQAFGKTPMFDHTGFNIENHFLHVGGLKPSVPDGQKGTVKGRIVSQRFMRTSDSSLGNCKIVFYYFNMAINSTVGKLQLFIQHRCVFTHCKIRLWVMNDFISTCSN